MNDIILSSIINLFALIGSRNSTDTATGLKAISQFLQRFYGIRDTGSYERLYSSLRDFYDDSPLIEKNEIVEKLCTTLSTKITPEHKPVIMLRLMEFCIKDNASFDTDDEFCHLIASRLGITDETYGKLCQYLRGTEGGAVLNFSEGEACIRTLFLEDESTLLFSYTGDCTVWMNGVRVEQGVSHIFEQSSVVKGERNFRPLYYSTIMGMYNPDSKQENVILQGNAIDFRFEQGGDNGMHNFSFKLHGGEMVAIMGGSGVGKTTLLSLLNGNLKPQSGSITINGHSIEEPEAKSLIGFVPQDDLLIEELTVYQNLWYTAKLCFEDMSKEALDDKVMTVLTDLGLDQAKDLKVGSPINKFISGGQRKRLNIALELIREPSILFLDEPTSGLSSSDTENVINLLKAQTDKGKLVITNIHQPSSDVFKMFDRLWLLDKGGYPIYDGNPIEAVSYFKEAANYADSQTAACPVCGNVNPELILNIIDEKMLDGSGHPTQKRKITPQEWHEMYLSGRAETPEPELGQIPETQQKKPSALKQMWIFLRRNANTKLTNLQYMLVTLLEAPLLALICAFLTHYTPDGGVYTLMDNKNFASYMFMAIIVSIFLGMSGSAEEIIKDRALLKREKFLSLSYGAYIWSKIAYMAVVCLIQTLLFILVGNAIIGVHGMFWIWWAVLFLSAFLSALIGLILSQSLNSVVAIYISIPLLLIPQILLCGLVVDFEDINPGSETGNVPVVGEVIPSRWAYEALSVASYSMNEFEAPYFEMDRERQEALFYRNSFVYELESQLATLRDEQEKGKEENPLHLAIIHRELPYITEMTGLEPYRGGDSLDAIDDYLQQAKKVLDDRCNRVTLAKDRLVAEFVEKNGKEAYTNLKKDHFNLKIEDLVLNVYSDHSHAIVGTSLVPRTGKIFLTPRSRCGRAPFYTGVKRLGDKLIPTPWFDCSILILMCLICGACLFCDFPGRFIRKGKTT